MGLELAGQGPLVLLCLAAFLLPLIGGTVSTDNLPLEPGYVPTMKAIFGGAEAPILSHAVLALLVCGSAAWSLASRRVVQVPMASLSILALAFFAAIGASVLFSDFGFTSASAAFEWAIYGVGFFAAIACVGRKVGTTAVASSLLAGCALAGLIGISEYMGQPDPTWRIFAAWQNPNALAGMLLIGLFAGCGLTMALRGVGAIFAGFGTVVCAFALVLTQSKGGYAAAAVGLLSLFILAILWIRGAPFPAKALGRVAVCLLALIALLGMLRMRGDAANGGSSPLVRVTQAADTQEQSSGFRMLLWRGAVRLMAERPIGWGVGAYRFVSARPGLTTQTHHAHNSFLQIGAEAGFVGILGLLAFAAAWLGYVFKGATRQEGSVAALKAGLVAAALAVGAHSMVDSDLHYFGTGLAFFVILGVGLQLSADGATPESLLPAPRWSAFALCILLPAGLFFFGAIEVAKAHVRANMAKGEIEPARAGIEALKGLGGRDGEVWYLAAVMSQTPEERIANLRKAAELAPSTKNLRALARELQSSGQPVEAASVFHRALARDPNNLLTLKGMLDLSLETKNDAEIERVANLLIEVEGKPYFQVRALPDLVPTQTYLARLVLARKGMPPKDRAQLLEPAWKGLIAYAAKTVPNVVQSVRAGLPGYGGETAEDARSNLQMALETVELLADSLRRSGQEERAKEVEASREDVRKALESLP
jgi:O-antigen ligase